MESNRNHLEQLEEKNGIINDLKSNQNSEKLDALVMNFK